MTTSLRSLLKDRGMTQSALAEATGLSTATISLMISGRRGYSRDSLTLIARALDVPVSALIAEPETTPDIYGLGESGVARVDQDTDDAPALAAQARQLAPSARQPALYIASRAYLWAAILPGDKIAVDIGEIKPGPGLVVAQIVDPQTAIGVSSVFRWAPPHLIALDAATHPVLTLVDGQVGRLWCNIVGPVRAVAREIAEAPNPALETAPAL